jgi:opacity protein-like surface antigen
MVKGSTFMESLVGKSSLVSFVALCVISFPVFSATGHMYAGASLGGSYAHIGNSSPQITYSSGVPIIDDYPLGSQNVSTTMLSLNGGYEYPGANWMPAIAVGLGLYTNPADYDFNGQVIETVTGEAPARLYNYTYNINNTRLMAEVQLTWLMKHLSPFISFGAGPGWNRTNSYMESVVTSTGFVALPPFQSRNNLNLAYQAGIGVSFAFNYANPAADFLQDRISIGYRYVNMGQTSFGTRGVEYPHSLNTGSLQTNDIYISYTHLFQG